MKNGKLLTVYLDEIAETQRLVHSNRLEDVRQATQRTIDEIELRAWRACLADGWTKEELDEAFYGRFGRATQG